MGGVVVHCGGWEEFCDCVWLDLRVNCVGCVELLKVRLKIVISYGGDCVAAGSVIGGELS